MVNLPPTYQPPGEKDLVIKSLRRDLERLRALLHDVDQCAPSDLNLLRDASEDLRWALQAVREELER